MGQFIDLTGESFGDWIVIQKALKTGNGKKTCIFWECQCSKCGRKKDIDGKSLRGKVSTRCDCNRYDFLKIKPPKKTHGYSKERLYRVWRGMIDRCYYPSHNRYSNYGGRGIQVCNEWRNDYLVFRTWAMASGYDPTSKRGDCTIDRIDVNGNYCPENCRWVDSQTQAKNKRKATRSA